MSRLFLVNNEEKFIGNYKEGIRLSRLIRGKMIRKRSRRIFQKNVVVLFCFMLLFSPFSTVLGDIVEDDSIEETIEITNLAELNEIRNQLDGNYRLGADVDLSEVSDWEPIGDRDNPFTGICDGNDFKITGMNDGFEGTDYDGLFGNVSDDATVEQIVVIFTGEMSEEESEGEETSEVELEEPIAQPFQIGLMNDDEGEEQLDFLGDGSGSVEDPYLIATADQLDKMRDHLDKHFKQTVDIDLEGYNWVPIGNRGDPSDGFSGTFNGNGKEIRNLNVKREHVGSYPESDGLGLFGAISGELKNINLQNVRVVGTNSEYVGGLVGQNFGGKIINVKMSGTIEGYEYVGGMIGHNSSGEVRKSSTTGKVIGGREVGGLVGSNYSSTYDEMNGIFDSYSSVNVFGSAVVGGLVGRNSFIIKKSYAMGAVEGKIVDKYAANYSNTPPSILGGLVGLSSGNIMNSYATGQVENKDGDTVGGLVGSASYGSVEGKVLGTVSESYATGNVSGKEAVGGLIGALAGLLDRTFAIGSVTGEESIGGLVGVLSDGGPKIKDSYSTGEVHASVKNVGGLVGIAYPDLNFIENSYSISPVLGGQPLGGLVGYFHEYNKIEIKSSFYNEVYSQEYKSGLAGKSTAELQTRSTFTDWDFDKVWGIDEGEYPHLQFYSGPGSQPSDEPILLHLKEEKEVQAGVTVKIAGTGTTIVLPNDLPAGTRLEVESVTPEAPGLTQSGEVFNFLFTFPDGSGFEHIDGDFILTLGIDDDADTGEVAIYHYNETTEAWELVGGDLEDGQITITVNEFSQYGVFSADSNIIYVKENGAGNQDGTSWDNAFATLQEGLDEATSDKQIWIAKGTYYPTKDALGNDNPANARTKTFQMKDGVAIYGAFKGDDNNETVAGRVFLSNETILSGDLGTLNDNSDNAYHVFYHPVGTNLDETAVLDGVTITAGNANNTSGPFDDSRGGGMYNNKSNPMLNNVNMSNNFASNGGGMYNLESNPILTNVDIVENRAGHGAGIMNVSSSPTLNYVKIHQNEATGDNGGGGGMMNLDDSNPTLTNVEITNNKADGQYGAGGGIYNEDSSPNLTDAIIANNVATVNGGGMYNKNSTLKMESITFESNSTTTDSGVVGGGGMLNTNSELILEKSVFKNNISARYGGGMYNGNSEIEMNNVDFEGNESTHGGAISNNSSKSVTVQGGTFTKNTSLATNSNGNGGAFYLQGNGVFDLTEVTIENNKSEGSGGAIYSSGANVTINEGEITNNDASGSGGGIYLSLIHISEPTRRRD